MLGKLFRTVCFIFLQLPRAHLQHKNIAALQLRNAQCSKQFPRMQGRGGLQVAGEVFAFCYPSMRVQHNVWLIDW